MSKQSLLLVDGDTRSLRVLEVSLRKAGFTVTPAESVQDALDKLDLHVPDLIISETKFPTETDGFELRRRVRANADWAEIPFVFLTTETAIENKIRGLELGVEDYLTKPIYIKEIVTRINILLAKKQRLAFEERRDGTRFAGRVADMPVVDVIQTIEVSRKSGVIQFTGPHDRNAAIYFRDGRVIDAEAGTLQGEDAVYRLLTWSEGDFEVVFRTVRRREAITTSSQGLLMEGMRRLDEWSRLLEQLPPLSHRFEIDTIELAARLGEVPDDNNRILRLIDGKRSLLEVIDASDVGDLECLQAISRLYFEGMLLDLDQGLPAKRITGKPMPLALVEEPPTPIEAVASGPINIADLAQRAGAPVAATMRAPSDPGTPTDEADVLSEETAVPQPRPSDPGMPMDEADVISEENAEPGPLAGQYRPSSLRLIDEAVAAAQLIEPSLFEDEPKPAEPAKPAEAAAPAMNGKAVAKVQLESRAPDPRIDNARDIVEANGARKKVASVPPPIPAAARARAEAPVEAIEQSDSVPTAIEENEVEVIPDEGPTDPSRRRFAATIRRDESGLRMIGSHGRDRAEASGELIPPPARPEPSVEPQRELVTIMPRRNTRELPAVVPPPEAEPAPPVEPPKPAPPPARVSVAGGTAAPPTGPGPIAKILIAAASVLVGAMVFAHCHKKHPATQPVTEGSGSGSSEVIATVPADAAEPIAFGIDASTVAVAADAGRPVTRPDAAVATVAKPDAAIAVVAPDAAVVAAATDAGAGSGDATDRVKQARDLLEKGQAALEDGDPEEALQLVDHSLILRPTARGYLERAKALQRLGRVDDALSSVDEAMKIVSNYAPAYYQRGMILWSARRYDEGRTALSKYLELAPDGRDAETVKKLLQEPR